MIRIPCPHCGPRDENEFVCAGEELARPDGTRPLGDALYAGIHRNAL